MLRAYLLVVDPLLCSVMNFRTIALAALGSALASRMNLSIPLLISPLSFSTAKPGPVLWCISFGSMYPAYSKKYRLFRR